MYKLLPILLFASGFSLTTNDIYDNSYALLIGIDKYENVKNLDYAVDDAKSIKDLLIEQFNFQPDNITLLINEKATYTKIKKSLSYVTRQAGENDRILIFFAGHGETIDLPESGEMGFLIPVDGENGDLYGTSLEMDELRKVSSLSKAKHILYLVDACYGGLAAINARALDVSSSGFIDKITRNKSRQIITAGGRGEPVIEKAEWGHSAFTLNVLRGLRDWNADLNMDGIITADELGLFLKEKVTIDSNNKQTPQSKRFTSHEGEFVFINKVYIENQTINFPSKTDNNITDVDELKEEIALLKEKLNKPVHFLQGCTNKIAENYNPKANFDDGSCIILKINDAYIRLGDFNAKDSLLEVYIETGIASNSIFSLDLLTRGFVITDIIDGIVYSNNNRGTIGNNIILLSDSGFNANYGEELLLRVKVMPTLNEFCIDKVNIPNYYVYISDCLTKLDVNISFPVTSFQSDSSNSIYFLGIDYKENMLQMGINLFLSDIIMPPENYYFLEINITNTISTGEELEGQIVFEKSHDDAIYHLGNFTSTNEYMELAELKKKEVEGVFDLQINEHPFNLNVNINNYISGSKICIENAVIYYNNDNYEINFENKIPLSLGSCIELQ